MLVVMKPRASESELARVETRARELGLYVHRCGSHDRKAVAVTGGVEPPDADSFRDLPGVLRVEETESPGLLSWREPGQEDLVVDVGGVPVGGRDIAIMAGPCAVENADQLMATAEAVKKAGARILRGGAYKPRTSPYTFQGLGREGLELLDEVRRVTGLRVVTEAVDGPSLEGVAEVADLIQIGARNMKSYAFLKHVGRVGRPVLLKRGMDATIEEWLLAAEYLLEAGAPGVVLCERGIRTFGNHARNTLDLTSVPAVKAKSHLPVIVDPSHGTGVARLVTPLARAALAVGADGLLVEVHPRPEQALSDARQALTPDGFQQLVAEVGAVAKAVNRRLG